MKHIQNLRIGTKLAITSILTIGLVALMIYLQLTGAADVEISRNTTSNWIGPGIFVSVCGALVQDNVVTGADGGIYVSGGARTRVLRNQVAGNARTPYDPTMGTPVDMRIDARPGTGPMFVGFNVFDTGVFWSEGGTPAVGGFNLTSAGAVAPLQ